MTPDEFRAERHALGLSQLSLAERLGTTKTSIYRYEAGMRKIPGSVAALLTLLSREKKLKKIFEEA